MEDMKLGDRVRFGSNAEVLDNLRAIGQQLVVAASKIDVQNKDDYLGFALNGLVRYSSIQVLRLVELYEGSIESHAWIARNLFEGYLLCAYIREDASRARQFVSQKGVDELQINEGFMTLCQDQSEPSLQVVRERNDRIKWALNKHATPVSQRPWRVEFLAKQTGNQGEYEAFFKLYSKYVHPSSWLIFGEPNETDTPVLANIFLIQAQYYAALILKIAQDFAGGFTQ
jgi:Family of unknown function (DUF5677)